MGTEPAILKNTRNIKFLHLPTPNSLLAQRNVLDTLSVPGGAALKQKWGGRAGDQLLNLLYFSTRSREMEAFGECHRQQTPGAFQAVFTHIADKQTRKAFRCSLYILQSTLMPTLIIPRGCHRGKKSMSFVYVLNIKLQIRLHLCTSITKVFPALEAEKLTLSRCFHTTLSAVHRDRPLRRYQNTR